MGTLGRKTENWEWVRLEHAVASVDKSLDTALPE